MVRQMRIGTGLRRQTEKIIEGPRQRRPEKESGSATTRHQPLLFDQRHRTKSPEASGVVGQVIAPVPRYHAIFRSRSSRCLARNEVFQQTHRAEKATYRHNPKYHHAEREKLRARITTRIRAGWRVPAPDWQRCAGGTKRLNLHGSLNLESAQGQAGPWQNRSASSSTSWLPWTSPRLMLHRAEIVPGARQFRSSSQLDS